MSTKGEEMDPKYFEIRDGCPSVNVKMGSWAQENPVNPRLIPYLNEARTRHPAFFDFAFESVAQHWWEDRVSEIAKKNELEPNLIEQDGRSGGWLVYRDRALADALHEVARDHAESGITVGYANVERWVAFVDAVEESLRDAAEDMRNEAAWLYAEALDERRERLIEEWNAAHPMHTTRPATDDPVFGFVKATETECGVCDGWGWVGHDELVPCPKCERGQENQRPRLGIDVPSPKYELHDVGTEANPYLNVPTVHDWALKKWMEGGNDA